MIERLAAQIWSQPEFQEDYRELRRRLCASVVKIEGASQPDETPTSRLLQAASVLALSGDANHRRAACDIAVGIRSFAGSLTDAAPGPSSVILDRLSYFPTSNLISSDLGADSLVEPLGLWLERETRREINRIPDGQSLTDFQKDVWDQLDGHGSFFLTAPTSAGKSYVLQQFVLRRLDEGDAYRAVFLVPTRALISQVSTEFREKLREMGLSDRTHVHTVPVPPHEPEKSVVWVLTQERLHYLLGRHGRVKIDLLVVDEAQQIGNDTRGILLQTVVETVANLNPELLLLLAGPSVVGLASAGKLFSLPEKCSTTESPVSQNFIRIRRLGGKKYAGQMYHLGEWLDLGEGRARRALGGKSTSEVQTIAQVVHELAPAGGSIIYVGQPGRCDMVARKLADMIDGPREKAGLLEDIASFLEQHIHKGYLLASTVRKGVGYHYREMPAIVRDAVERAFASGHLRFLVCTSTLLQGVNLPANSIFVFNPTKGSSQPIEVSELMNLVGRAGRLSHDLYGNVIAIEPEEWKTGFETPVVAAEDVAPALKVELSQRREELLSHVRQESEWLAADDATQTTFSRLILDHRASRVQKTYRDLGLPPDPEVSDAISAASRGLSRLSDEIIERNITVSPYRLLDLHEWVEAAVSRGMYDTIKIRRPDRSGGYESILQIFQLIHRYLRPSNPRLQGDSYKYFALLAHKWARGLSLEQILREDIAFKKIETAKQTLVAARIRDVLGDIEDIVRFEYVRLCQCFEDGLREALARHGMREEAEKMLSLTLYLEVGAVDPQMITLIGLGLSRTTSGLVLPHLSPSAESERALLESLRRVYGLPSLAQRELDEFLGRKSR